MCLNEGGFIRAVGVADELVLLASGVPPPTPRPSLLQWDTLIGAEWLSGQFRRRNVLVTRGRSMIPVHTRISGKAGGEISSSHKIPTYTVIRIISPRPPPLLLSPPLGQTQTRCKCAYARISKREPFWYRRNSY